MTPFLPNPHAHRRRPEPHQVPKKAYRGAPSPSLTPAQRKEATRRHAKGATLQELADSYDGQRFHRAPSHVCRMSSPPRDRQPRLLFESLNAELEASDTGPEHRGDTGNGTHDRHDRAETSEQHHAADNNRPASHHPIA
jgi:hypothetical protein